MKLYIYGETAVKSLSISILTILLARVNGLFEVKGYFNLTSSYAIQPKDQISDFWLYC